MPELPEVEVVRAGLERHVVGATLDRVEVLHPRPVRRDPRGSTGFAAALTGRRVEAARRRGKYFWLALDNGDARARPPRHERPDARAAGRRARRPAPAGPVHARRRGVRGHRAAVRRPADVRRAVRLRGRRRPAARDRPHRPRPARPGVRRGRVRPPRPQAHLRDQAAAARPDPGLGCRQHLRRRGPVARDGPRRAPRRPAAGGQGPRAARPGPRGDGRGPGGGRHVVRRAVRQRQRPVRLLRPLAARLRPGGPARATAAAPRSAGSPS